MSANALLGGPPSCAVLEFMFSLAESFVRFIGSTDTALRPCIVGKVVIKKEQLKAM